MNINTLVTKAHDNARAHGFWDADQNIGNKCALIHSEVSEFFEGYRKGKHVEPDEHCPNNTNQSIELADIIIRVADLAGYLCIDLEDAIKAKMDYNKGRPHLHGKKF